MTSFDPKRQAAAKKRADEARRDARYHEQQAAAAIAKAQQIERTWGIERDARKSLDCVAGSE